MVFANTYQKYLSAVTGNNKIIKNAASLGIIQITNFIVPIITFPYIVNVIGVEKFGVVSYGLTLIYYMTIIVDYGFTISATRNVAMNREDNKYLNKLFNEVFLAKVILLFFCVLLFLCIAHYNPLMNKELITFSWGILMVLGNVILPVWFFQGMEEMKYLTYSNLAAKFFLLFLIGICITESKHYTYILGIYGTANLISGIYAMGIVVRKYKFKIWIPRLKDISNRLKDGWNFFSANLLILISTNVNVLLLGMYVDTTAIGNYSISEKIIMVIWQLVSIYSQAVYPQICRLAGESHEKLLRFIFLSFWPVAAFVVVLCTVIYLSSAQIAFYMAGESNSELSSLLLIVCYVPLIVCFNVPAYQILLAYNQNKLYNFIFAVVAIVNLALSWYSIKNYGVTGAAISLLIIQILTTLSLHIGILIMTPQYSLFKSNRSTALRTN